MKRREFLKVASAAVALPSWFPEDTNSDWIDLSACVAMSSVAASARERLAVSVLIEEAEKRCGIRWKEGAGLTAAAQVTVYVSMRRSPDDLLQRAGPMPAMHHLRDEGFLICHGKDMKGDWIAIIGADERGTLFGVGKFLRLIDFGRERAKVKAADLNVVSHPQYQLRGHQLGYRPKTNSYDGWTVTMWDHYIRDLALFGTNAIELVPPRSDDSPDSPLFPIPPEQMMVQMSRIADNYGLDVWIWYPALDKDYGNEKIVQFALEQWAHIFQILPRIDAIFVPGGDPGRTPPKDLFALLEKQKTSLKKYHPKAKLWMSSQGFDAVWTEGFLTTIRQAKVQEWLDGIVFAPMSRLSVKELRAAVPAKYPIRCYPDITHSVWCQYPVPEWDIAFALTEGREIINPRPEGETNIARHILPESIGFISYSEGCNDDVNKFIWSAIGWDSTRSVSSILEEFSRYFIGARDAHGFAQGLMSLESNWKGPLATNTGVELTLARFQDIERRCTPAVLGNWRFQQALFRAYFDAFVRRRLLDELDHVARARDQLESIFEIGWSPIVMGASPPAKDSITNGFDPDVLLHAAQDILEETVTRPAGGHLRKRVAELGEALFQSIRMQLAVERYQGQSVRRGAPLDSLDHPVTDTMWLRSEIIAIRKLSDPIAQLGKIKELLFRTDPGPGGYYDELGDPSNRSHLVLGAGSHADPDFRLSPATDSLYPDTLQASAPIAWKHWVQSEYDTPIKLHYEDLDRESDYHVQIVYGGDEPRQKIRLDANDGFEIHPLLLRPWPPSPQKFAVPMEATRSGALTLTWTGEQGMGADGRGCQIAEVWLIQRPLDPTGS